MDSLRQLFTTMDGRIGRRQFWLGAVLIVVFSIVLSLILMLLGFRTLTTGTEPTQLAGQPANTVAFWQATLNPWASLVVSVLSTIPLIVISIKRRHDRDNAGLDAVAVCVLVVVVQLLQALGVNGTAMQVFTALVFIASLYLLVVAGFLRGTAGANSYGPDPLA